MASEFKKKSKYLWPILLFLIVLVLFVVNWRQNRRSPEIEVIHPSVGLPGDMIVIQGRFFDDEVGSPHIQLSDIPLYDSSIVDWSDTAITLRLPEGVRSGFIYVSNENGISDGRLFTNLRQVPVVVDNANGTAPDITGLSPSRVLPGGLVTLSGYHFGENPRDARILLKMGSMETSALTEDSLLIPDEDIEILSWSDEEIVFRLPYWAASGEVAVEVKGEKGTQQYLEVLTGPGTRYLKDKRTYSFYYDVLVDDLTTASGRTGELYVWVPLPYPAPSQQEINLLNQSPEPFIQDIQHSSLYFLEAPMDEYKITKTYIFDCYTWETQVDPDRIVSSYDTDDAEYKRYIGADGMIDPNETRMPAWGWWSVGNVTNPYRRARLIYDQIIGRLDWVEDSGDRTLAEIMDDTREADTLDYVRLFCSMTRVVGIPSRPVAGYFIDETNTPRIHYWAEFLVPDFGWVPVDLVLAEGVYPLSSGEDPVQYSFGNVDNRHIIFSRGIKEVRRMFPDGEIVSYENQYSFQTIFEETSGEISNYRIRWNTLRINGIY